MPFCPPDCLIELEPMLRRFDEIDVLEAVLEVKRSKVSVKEEPEMVTFQFILSILSSMFFIFASNNRRVAIYGLGTMWLWRNGRYFKMVFFCFLK